MFIRFALFLTASLLFSGCISEQDKKFAAPIETTIPQTVVIPVSSLEIPDNVMLVSLGEATHGNHELYALKKEVFKVLVKKYNYQVFALEGDFGNCSIVNDYIVADKGTALEAVYAIGFGVYKNEEMVELIQWLHDENMNRPQSEKIRFYGFDMQRYDNNKKGLFEYIEKVDISKLAEYKQLLFDLNDDTVFNQKAEKIKSGLSAITNIISNLEQQKEVYIASSSKKEYDFALQYALTIQQCATVRLPENDGAYGQLRDEYMAKKIEWILNQEKEFGNGKVFLSAHNGHISKFSATPGVETSMGAHLEEIYGKEYFSIGTELNKSTFNPMDHDANERKNFTITNDSSLVKAFLKTNQDEGLLIVEDALKDPDWSKLLSEKQSMTQIGDAFGDLYHLTKKMYTLQIIPEKAYDAIIFVKTDTPTIPIKIDDTKK